MAEAQLFGLQDEFTCSLCLDTLTDPVTILCGHSFCLKCLTDCWDQSQKYSCPQCRHTFTKRPELNRNTLLNEVIKKLKKMTISSPPQNYACHGDVECDFCTGKKFRTHLQPHYEGDALKHHKLVDPDRNLKEKLCEKHLKSLEIFCKTDDSCICLMCVRSGAVRIMFLDFSSAFNTIQPLLLREKLTEMGVDSYLMAWIVDYLKDRPQYVRLGNGTSDIVVSNTGAPQGTELSPSRYTLPDFSLIFFSLLSDFCPLTLDINTAHRWLRLSERNQKVTRERTEAKYPAHPDRFDCYAQVLCREAQTGTRCYWEMECSGHFMTIGVACKGLRRKGGSVECILGNNDKSWCLLWSHSKYSVCHNNQETEISAPYSPRIGVYLDWPAGSLSFYSVSHTMTLLHRFNTSFTECHFAWLFPSLGSKFNLHYRCVLGGGGGGVGAAPL
uniref:Tripartite motif-containing protein 16-like n=1 Tax=Erpetoichthys calabaricus TaxID=27687 RepID=A0A8C4SRB6_ERPCA